jgi:hypothetical protein
MREQLEICKKALADFLDGRRRQFPRYYFTSEADLLDILSNGSQPKKVGKHMTSEGSGDSLCICTLPFLTFEGCLDHLCIQPLRSD